MSNDDVIMPDNAVNEAARDDTKHDHDRRDPQWNGPAEIVRTHTDKNWLIVFLVYLVIYFACAVYVFVSADLKKLENRLDIAGHICGIDPDFINKTYVMHLNLNQEIQSNYYSPKICVSQCPTENFIYDNTKSIDELKTKLMCTDGVNITAIESIDEIDLLISEDKCARWYLKSRPILDNCIAYETWRGHEIDTITESQLFEATEAVLNGKYFLKKFYRISQSVWKPTLLTLLVCVILTLLSILILRYSAEPFFYISIVTLVVLLIVAIYFLKELYLETVNAALEPVILVFLIICVLLVIFIVLSVLCTHKKIHLACLLVEESAKAVMHLPATLVYPFFSSILKIAILAFFIVYLLCLLTMTVPIYTIKDKYRWKINDNYKRSCYCQDDYYEIGDSCDPDKFNHNCTGRGQDCQWLYCRFESETIPAHVYLIHIINAWGFFWISCFIGALECMVLAGTFATWYWTLDKRHVGNHALIASFGRTLRYHLGTIALGSLVLTITECVTGLLQQAVHQHGDNTSGQLFMSMMYHQSDMFKKVIGFLSKNAYVMCAVHGTNFFKSCKSAFNLIIRNLTKVIVVHTVADTLFMVTGLFIVAICIGGLVAYLNNTLGKDSNDEPWIFWITIVISFIGTAMISNVFLKAISIAVRTIFLCFVEDYERNDGSKSRPYYMSGKLKNLLQR